jgi:hypothetical protein
VIAIATQGDDEINNLVEHTIYIPQAPELLLPILEVVPRVTPRLPHHRKKRLRRRSTQESRKSVTVK